MSYILYYSNYCENCKKLLPGLSKSDKARDINFLCIDKRVKRNNNIYIILENNQEILLPSTISSVPSLLLIKENYRLLQGDEIYNYLKPILFVEKQVSTNYNGEPSAFSLYHSNDNIISDNYSFLDQDSDDLSAKGNGGTRQMYNYAGIEFIEKIVTPDENYIPDKIGDVSIEQLQNQRT